MQTTLLQLRRRRAASEEVAVVLGGGTAYRCRAACSSETWMRCVEPFTPNLEAAQLRIGNHENGYRPVDDQVCVFRALHAGFSKPSHNVLNDSGCIWATVMNFISSGAQGLQRQA